MIHLGTGQPNPTSPRGLGEGARTVLSKYFIGQIEKFRLDLDLQVSSSPLFWPEGQVFPNMTPPIKYPIVEAGDVLLKLYT